jgi:hypothetical protein
LQGGFSLLETCTAPCIKQAFPEGFILHPLGAAVTGHIGAEEGRQFTLELILCHDPPPETEGLANPG